MFEHLLGIQYPLTCIRFDKEVELKYDTGYTFLLSIHVQLEFKHDSHVFCFNDTFYVYEKKL